MPCIFISGTGILILSKLLFCDYISGKGKEVNTTPLPPVNNCLQRSSQIHTNRIVNVEGSLAIITYHSYFIEQTLPVSGNHKKVACLNIFYSLSSLNLVFTRQEDMLRVQFLLS